MRRAPEDSTHLAPAPGAPAALLAELLARWREIWLLHSTSDLLGWDEETMMPAAGAAHRGAQLALLAGLAHERIVHPRLAELCDLLEAAKPGDDGRAQVRHVRRAIHHHSRIPRALLEEQKKVFAVAQRAWVAARAERSFSSFAPHLARVVELKREEARCLSGGAAQWGALLDEFEPGAEEADVLALLARVRARVEPIVRAAVASPTRADAGPFLGAFDVDKQRTVVESVARMLGYDLERGRIDTAPHPFCSSPGDNDVRVAVRYSATDLRSSLYALIHEVGHALYEQGVPRALLGTPAGSLSSLGLHESQSRLWENQVGRAPAFWRHVLPWLQGTFGGPLADASLDDVVRATNAVLPGPIRVGADEATYNLHICIRVDLERALIGGDLQTHELPGAWGEAYRAVLGIDPIDDAEGCLQDGHWAAGMFGYFPTYTLGNVYAAQLFDAARRALPDLDAQMAAGRFDTLVGWLRRHVHERAALAPASVVVADATGTAPHEDAFVRHLQNRLTEAGLLL